MNDLVRFTASGGWELYFYPLSQISRTRKLSSNMLFEQFDQFQHHLLNIFCFLSTSLIYAELKVAWYDLELYACIEICFYLTRVSCYCFDFSYLSVQSFSKSTCKETKLKIVQCDWPSVWECQPSELWSQRLQYISTRVSISTSNFKPRLFNHELFNYEYLLQPWTFQALTFQPW